MDIIASIYTKMLFWCISGILPDDDSNTKTIIADFKLKNYGQDVRVT